MQHNQQFWPGSKIPMSTNNAFNIANAGAVKLEKITTAQVVAKQQATITRATSNIRMVVDRPVGGAAERQGASIDFTKIGFMRQSVDKSPKK